jgi:hypothetical protein
MSRVANVKRETQKARSTLSNEPDVQEASAIGAAIAGPMKPHLPGGSTHYTTHDHIISVDGDQADIDAQFIVFNTVGELRPDDGWTAGASAAQGTITQIESGYSRSQLQPVDGTRKIVHHEILHALPMAFPGPRP